MPIYRARRLIEGDCIELPVPILAVSVEQQQMHRARITHRSRLQSMHAAGRHVVSPCTVVHLRNDRSPGHPQTTRRPVVLSKLCAQSFPTIFLITVLGHASTVVEPQHTSCRTPRTNVGFPPIPTLGHHVLLQFLQRDIRRLYYGQHNIVQSPLPTPTIVDDSAVRQEPSRQVDFLSHEWREEDIWSSWRNIVSQRKTVYGERSRLENASWRTWAKAKFDLRTVSPEQLNWLKESDVTWLYGPLKLAPSNSFINKKPILKKRSVSEVMLQKSLSTSSLVKQAAAQVQAQGREGRRSGPEVIDSKLQSETPSRDQVDYFTSWNNSTGGTPCETHEKRHIRFDDRVEQCIAVDCKDPGPEDEDESDDEEVNGQTSSSDSSSDDGVVMMKRKKRSGPKKSKSGSRSNSANGRRIIETLPATTLKYRTDSPDVTEEAQHHTFGRSWNSSKLSPSPSQETLRPARHSSNFLLPGDEDEAEEDDIDSDSSWTFGASNNKSALGTPSSPTSRSSRSRSSTPGPRESHYEIEGMRRTESGMFMPYDDDEDDIIAAGLFGRVSETINTARDIAHVIWNVGWRK
ncbi:uncharacterized protein MYCFIDRAFT_85630 [Pseudocercospora fijiensis CIRAD86]|uniref:Nitrogen regulatory protein areA GATA-like domain-containing protein n=1 Tax=Pseudocercospora fijiensis (strain CIRAD86) TaxID=383855 RepID=N1Q5S4_PSEFD|nr:uncharacterized protein MYCFIDRAFT_85630 [Pseudocercospora fijiensis CIRAD86]EME87314.1 hypothetical protein MYCFIDRAFT_85630 [Pseudocercospora fijiensis CIRAD86]